MADDPTKRGQSDRSRINVNEKHELRHWSKKFSVSPDRLREVVDKVGTRVEDVERALSGGGNAPGRDASQGT
jgi:hypothetical protein